MRKQPVADANAALRVELKRFRILPDQTKYYFLSGFTAKLAGTERGITEPTPTFSSCFGQAFLELHPTKYAEELVKRMEMRNWCRHRCQKSSHQVGGATRSICARCHIPA